jgi:hypothetical protein|tara:strand:- start:3650 stop:4006 length:357 start_codon:yes stop_codon:yes gene_type:complete
MSIPTKVFTFVDSAVAQTPSPFVRNHNAGFPAVVYTFEGDDFLNPIPAITAPRLVRYDTMVLCRTIEEAETIGELIIVAARSETCPMRVTGVTRAYEPAYDGERQGIYIHTTSLEFFS